MERELLAWAIVRDGEGRVLLARRGGTGRGEGLWNLPGGHLEPGETAAEAAARELLEEVGLTGTGFSTVLSTAWQEEASSGVSEFLLAAAWEGTPSPLENTSEVGWFAPSDLPPDCLPWLPDALCSALA